MELMAICWSGVSDDGFVHVTLYQKNKLFELSALNTTKYGQVSNF